MYEYRPKYYDEALYRGFLDATGIRLESYIRHDPSTFVAKVVRDEEVLWKGEYAKSDLISIDDQLDITNIQREKGLAFAREILDEVDWDDFFPTPEPRPRHLYIGGSRGFGRTVARGMQYEPR